MSHPTAVLLMAHGSRRASANDDLAALAKMLRDRQVYPIVEIGFLELAEPSIPEGARRCVERGAGHVKMLPYFLSAGTHVVSDLEEFRQQLTDRFPAVTFELSPHLGLHPLMIEIVLDRLRGDPVGLLPASSPVTP